MSADKDEASAETGPLTLHQSLRTRFEKERVAQDAVVGRFSMAQLALFGLSMVLLGSGLFGVARELLYAGAGVFLLFLVVRALQTRVISRRDAAQIRRDIHDRQVMRMTGRLEELPGPGAALPPGHPYAGDLDISGPASILARIDTTHTSAGAGMIATWLASPAPAEEIPPRQEAVKELAAEVDLRQELEAAVLETGRERLDARAFVELMEKKGVLEEQPWLRFVAPLLPLVTVGLGVAGSFVPQVPAWAWLLPLAIQIFIVRKTEPRSREVYQAMGEKKGFVDAYVRLFRVVEGAKFDSARLRELQTGLDVHGAPPSVQMKRLDRWTSWYELREQGIVWIFVNPLLLWDLNCLVGIEAWIRNVGRKCGDWFTALGQIEALASLSVLLHQDLFATLPEVVEDGGLVAEQVAHPLLPSETRVANDVSLDGPGTCLIVTGSNMAGKSTLLRAVGVNIVLALAGGPVIARAFRVPRVRVRASMRIADSLQSGASYFQAELSRLRLVVHRAEAKPPIFFLLDELLRGTNAKARHIGARAVVSHLIERGAMGFVATHDVALSKLEDERPSQVHNVHFTDVIHDGQMTFDYHLRPGVVKTSNALRLLAEVGIAVEDDPNLLDGAQPAPEAVVSRVE